MYRKHDLGAFFHKKNIVLFFHTHNIKKIHYNFSRREIHITVIIFDHFWPIFWPFLTNFDHFILDAIWKGHMRVESCTIFLLSLDKCREGRITSNGLWRRQAPFGLRTWGWDPSIAWNDFLRVIRGVRGVPEGVFRGVGGSQ